MPTDRKLPAEIVQFESFLKKPNSDPTGLAGFFNSGEMYVTRVPARLDVIGGISDYSGIRRQMPDAEIRWMPLFELPEVGQRL